MRDRLGGGDRLGEALYDGDGFGRGHRIERFRQPPRCLIEPGDERAAEPARERGAGHGGELADGFDPQPFEQVAGARFEPQRSGRQRGERVGVRAGRADLRGVAGERPGRARRIRHGNARGEAVPL
ncbi:hypothetical protein D9M73_157290 [compost metagenome]